mmetsp:Transcript_27696/g.41919  ORF Transcript_27696/g.41919 Transcript_27696/m.41919 type:complete len:113 (+) Transcript_27696:75-413(+)
MIAAFCRNTIFDISKHVPVRRQTILHSQRALSSLEGLQEKEKEGRFLRSKEDDCCFSHSPEAKHFQETHVKENIIPVMKELNNLMKSNVELSEDTMQAYARWNLENSVMIKK